jgi:asparagine synthase (glutamine-hydrolysing)
MRGERNARSLHRISIAKKNKTEAKHLSGIGGIAGYGVGTLAAAQVCDGILAALRQRGADGQGTFISEEVCLMHTGYISETCEGGCKQPIKASLGNKTYVLVFEGELYNKAELQNQLVEMGYPFHKRCDAEIVLKSYMAWGFNCAEKFDGEFTFALWDGAVLFFARDIHGARPLFYSAGSYGMVFASTERAVCTHPRIRIAANESASEIQTLCAGDFGIYIPGKGIKIEKNFFARNLAN